MAADGRVEAQQPYTTSSTASGPPPAPRWQFPHIFRSFQVALDPRKLFVAALGILAVSVGWWLLSVMFDYKKPIPDDYNTETLIKQGAKPPQESPTDKDKADFYEAEKERQYAKAFARWKVMNELAGEGGKLRTLPWNEYRGQNPYLFASALSSQPSATWGGQVLEYLSQQMPVLIEPLFKLVLPVFKLSDPNASTYTRIYLVLCLAWSVAC